MAENKKSPEKTKENDGRKCKTCKSLFHSILDYVDHLESKEHRKNIMKMKYGEKYLKAKLKLEKEDQENSDSSDSNGGTESSDSETEVYTCEVCKKICTGRLNYKLHLNGKNHKKMTKKMKMLKEMKDKQNIHEETTPIEDNQILDSIFSDTKFASSCITCQTCNKKFSGPENYKQHMKSETHKKKQCMQNLIKDMEGCAVSKSGSSSENYECDICKKKLSNPEVYKQHLESNRHLKNKMNRETMSQLGQEVEFKGPKMQCEVCKKIFSGAVPLKIHLDSTIHKKKETQNKQLNELCNKHPEIEITPYAQSEDSDEDVLIMCSICHVAFSGPASALDHATSQKHKKAAKYKKFKQKKLKKLGSSPVTIASSTKEIHTNSDEDNSGENFELL